MAEPSSVSTLGELADLLRDLRRRQARRACSSPLSYGELAARTGWPAAAIDAWFAGRSLPPAQRLDALLRLLEATPAERSALADAVARLDGAAVADAPARPEPPAAPAGFIGRAGAVARLDRLLPGARAVLVDGPAGVGKTALAVHYAHRVADRFPDGVIRLDLRGDDPAGAPLSPAEALRALLVALGMAPADLPLGVAARTGMYRGLTARRGVLIVLDAAADAAQVRPLLPAAGDSVALVTGRVLAGLSEVDGVRPLPLGPLDRTEARALLAARIGAERAAAEPAAVDRIIAACDRRPMALVVASARIALRPALALAAAADALAGGAFAWTYGLLSPNARRLYRGFGAHPGPDLTAAAAAVLIGRSEVDGAAALAELARAGLVGAERPGRHAMPALLRADALARTPAAERGVLQDRLIAHYATGPADAGPGALRAALGLAVRRGRHRDACRLAEAADGPLDAAGLWDDRIAVHDAAIAAAERLDDPGLGARARRAQAAAYLRTGQHEAAGRRLREAADGFLAAGDAAGAARSRRELAGVLEAMARFAEAIVHDELAVALFRRAGDPGGQAGAHAAAAWHYAQAGRGAEAVAHGEAALRLRLAAGEAAGIAAARLHLGRVHAALGQGERAVARYREALDGFAAAGDPLGEADAATRLGDALEGAPQIGLWRRALAVYERLDPPSAAAVVARLGL